MDVYVCVRHIINVFIHPWFLKHFFFCVNIAFYDAPLHHTLYIDAEVCRPLKLSTEAINMYSQKARRA